MDLIQAEDLDDAARKAVSTLEASASHTREGAPA